MNFTDAIKLLKSGSKVTREIWATGGYFVKEVDGIKYYQHRIIPYDYNADIMTSIGWIIDGEEGTFDFPDVVQFLKHGRKARLDHWKDVYIYLDGSTHSLVTHIWEQFPFSVSFDSFVAQDWIEV